MNNTLELTSAELELIENKRKQDALEQEAAKLKKEAKIQKESIEIQNSILKEQKEANLQVAAATEYYNGLVKLDPKYKLEVTEHELKKEIKDYSGPEAIVIKSFNYTIKKAQIILSDSPYYITVEKHIVYTGMSFRGTDKGYKMELKGGGFYSERKVSKAKVINDKIVNKRQAEIDKKIAEQKKASGLDTAYNNLVNKYPQATIIKSTEWERNSYDKRSGGESINIITITLPNSISIKYKVYSDGSLGRKEIRYPFKNNFDLLDTLNNIIIPQ
jgi:hypothetical protein